MVDVMAPDGPLFWGPTGEGDKSACHVPSSSAQDENKDIVWCIQECPLAKSDNWRARRSVIFNIEHDFPKAHQANSEGV